MSRLVDDDVRVPALVLLVLLRVLRHAVRPRVDYHVVGDVVLVVHVHNINGRTILARRACLVWILLLVPSHFSTTRLFIRVRLHWPSLASLPSHLLLRADHLLLLGAGFLRV